MGIESERQMALHCPLGEDVLLVRHLQGTERLSTCFEYTLTLYSEDANVQAESLLGQHASVRVRCGKQPERFFDGIVCAFGQTGQSGRYWLYRMVLRPWLWLLSRNRDCRVFQRETALDIFREILQGYDDKALTTQLTYALEPREYCVQYRESDLSFVSRLLEEEGIYYYFKHEQGTHTLVLADSADAHEPVAELEELSMRRSDKDAVGPSIFSWHTSKRIQPGVAKHTDYDFTKPNATLLAQSADPSGHPNAQAEVFDYPGLYTEASVGSDRARIRMQELAAGYETSEGSTDAVGLFPGALFTLKDPKREVENRQYLITSASYDADSGGFESGSHSAQRFALAISALDNGRTFRPPRRTAAPVIVGAQTATVVGPTGHEIWTNEHGQVKVQFHWDRRGERDENSSCFVRVAQSWAGGRWGAQFIPRIGQEVVVAFLEGNPDRPLITGAVYNAENGLPFTPPGKQTQSGFKTQSTPGGSANEYNELRFEDDKGHEEIHLQAQRDLTLNVKHDSATSVGRDATCKVKRNVSVTVAEGDHDTRVSKGAMRADVPESLYGATAKEIALSATDAITLRVGDASLRIDGTSIALTVGQSAEIKIDLTQIAIVQPTMVNINPPGSVPTGPAQLPDLLTRMCSPEGES